MRLTVKERIGKQIARLIQALLAKVGCTAVLTASLNQFESDYIACVKANGARYWKRHYVTRL